MAVLQCRPTKVVESGSRDRLSSCIVTFYTARSAGQKGCVNMQQWDGGWMLKNLSYDWSMRISRVIFVVLPLVRIY